MDDFESFKNKLSKIADDFNNGKEKELEVITNIAEGNIKSVTPVLTGTLKRSITHKIINPSTSEVGPGAEAPYAEAVNYGHKTRNGGFVKGQHYMEKGLQAAEPQMDAEINRWVDELFSRV